MSYPVTARHVRTTLDCQRAAFAEVSPALFVLAVAEALALLFDYDSVGGDDAHRS